MKKSNIMATLLAGCLLFAVAGCSSPTEETPKDEVRLTVTSNIFGIADTGNKTTLKKDLLYTGGLGDANLYYYNENGERVIYENQKKSDFVVHPDPVTYSGAAVLSFKGDVDNSLIDSSQATVRLAPGSGYHVDELILGNTSLDGNWVNGAYTYTLDVGDLEWNTWGYDTSTEPNSGREWSVMGGDGNGFYRFNLEASGILYDGQEMPAVTFPVEVYIYGRSQYENGISNKFVENTVDTKYTANLAQGNEAQWTWYTKNATSTAYGRPYMSDTYTDYFTITWPEGTDASAITAHNVTVTLKNDYGESYKLSTKTPYGEKEYQIIAREKETVIAVTYQQWAFIPVYTDLEIEIKRDSLTAKNSWDICSVYAFLVQTGGGGKTLDHTNEIYNYYGITGLTKENATNSKYTLSATIGGKKQYYAEDNQGNAYLTTNVNEAWTGDATNHYNIAVYGNAVFTEQRTVNSEKKTVDGTEYTFTMNCNIQKSFQAILDGGATLEDGYAISPSGTMSWAWTDRYQSGWIDSSPKPTSSPYSRGTYPFGFVAGSYNSAYAALSGK